MMNNDNGTIELLADGVGRLDIGRHVLVFGA